MKNVWQKILAVALCALTLAACRTLPEQERADAETAYKKAQISKQCKTDKYMAAESLIIEARKNVNDKKYEEAKIAFATAEKMFKEAEEEAKKDPNCNKQEDASAKAKDEEKPKIDEMNLKGTNVKNEGGLGAAGEEELATIFFPFDSSDITDEAAEILKKNAKWLEKRPEFVLIIEGHCDQKGSVDYNLALGARRAEAVKQYLITLGISPERLKTISYGKERPLDDRNVPDAWNKNRRAEFKPQKKK